jgi:thiopeptide-type bacteriocin biosynthesis protein
MEYTFAPYLLLRMPVKSPADYDGNFQHFLNDRPFRSAIYLASPVFYSTLEKHGFKIDHLTEKELTTLQKYVNRYCFRPTPFGLFASITLLKWPSQVNTSSKIKLSVHVNASMAVQNHIYENWVKPELIPQISYTGNPSLYRLSNEYRFFRTHVDDAGKQRNYLLQSIAFTKLLKELIANCGTGSTRKSLEEQIVQSAGCTEEEARDYTDFLIDSQLLVSCQGLSITGDDPLTYLEKLLTENKRSDLFKFIVGSKTVNMNTDPSMITILEQDLENLAGVEGKGSELLNIVVQRHAQEPYPPIQFEEQLRTGLMALELLSTTGNAAAISQFINNFQQHFEGQSLPLLLALDPEAGVGYQYVDSEKSNPLLETLYIPYRNQPSRVAHWSPVHSTLMEAWLRDKSEEPVIRLSDGDLEQLKSTAISQPMLGMSVLFRVSENQVFIENAGGINAPALMGRFSAVDEEIAEAARGMAKVLEAQYPDVIFAELLHLANPHTDNINRRAQIYQYELPITATSHLPASQQIPLSDLYIKVVDNKVMLYSQKHKKIVIPRLTSAYNHSLNKLPLFRFLTDLPYQYGRSNLGLDLRTLFPDLSFYPRVEYKGVILSLATWTLNETQLADLQNRDPAVNAMAFYKLSTMRGLPRHFSFSEGDQELVFDQEHTPDVHFFCNCIRHKKEAVIKEFLNQQVIQQYNAYLLPAEAVALPQLNPDLSKAYKQRKFIPGSEWLYLKVYSPKAGFNKLLLKLNSLIRRRYGKHKIDKWFFIRYEDRAPHIRLRIMINPEAISDVLLAFKNKLEDDIHQHVIREFQIDVYSRELERYAAGGIENTEHFFWASSELVHSFLKNQHAGSRVDNYLFGLYSTLKIIKQFFSNYEDGISFTFDSFQQFLPEFTGKSLKVDLDKNSEHCPRKLQLPFKQQVMTCLAITSKRDNYS